MNLKAVLTLATIYIFLILPQQGFSQRPESAQLSDMQSGLWLNSYGNFRLSDKFFWIAQLHYRRANSEEVPLVGKMGQIYNRHAINYMVSNRFNMSLGGVLRLDYNPDPELPGTKNRVLEYRIWHEYLFVVPFERFMTTHRFRIEHRWSRGFEDGEEYIFRNRWRYSFNLKLPINKPTLSPGAFYFGPDIEIILQSGPPVVDSPLEDLRLIPAIGYIYNPRVTFATGPMYSLGQKLSDGAYYRQRIVWRLHMYISLDFRKLAQRLPDVRIND